jgi:hypothetical protein
LASEPYVTGSAQCRIMSHRTREVTVRKAASSEKIRWDYRAALDMAAETEEIFASQLALLADELER